MATAVIENIVDPTWSTFNKPLVRYSSGFTG
jgi:hypothetical protein